MTERKQPIQGETIASTKMFVCTNKGQIFEFLRKVHSRFFQKSTDLKNGSKNLPNL